MKLNMYELAYQFWRLAEEQSFTQSETSLYFLLLHRANLNRWEMPVRCPVTTACMLMGTSKQNILKARAGLIERGLISYARSDSRGRCGQYMLLSFWQSQLPYELTNELTKGLSLELPLYKIEDKEQKTSIINAREKLKSVDELECEFNSDSEWIQKVVTTISSPYIQSSDDVRTFIHHFFDIQRISKVNEREEADCRQHFINWLKKQIQKTKDTTNEQSKYSDRRGTPASGNIEKRYDAPFMPAR